MNTNSACGSTNGMVTSEYDIWKKNPVSATQEWVASLPIDQDTCNSLADETSFSLENDPSLAASKVPAIPVVSRKLGIQGFYNGKQNATDIYQLAQATRKARERQSTVDYGYSSTISPGEHKNQDRAFMLRTAYAAQRFDQPNTSFQSETTFSYDSSLDFLGNEEPDAENLLILLGFGGPSQGLDRIPERFLQPSQLRGVNVEQFLTLQQELDDAMETGSLGYRGLSGPSTRRPSTIVARLMERMRDNSKDDFKLRRTSTPSSSIDNPSFSTNKNERNDLLSLTEESIAEEQSLTIPLESSCPGSRKSSLSSRKSSLKRQERIEVDDEKIFDESTTYFMTSLSVSQDSSGFHDLSQCNASQGVGLVTTLLSPAKALAPFPSVYVSPPPSIVFSHSAVIEATETQSSFCSSEVDPIISVLQLATEAYRIRLECFPVTAGNVQVYCERSDWNHNQFIQDDSTAVKEDIRQELARTDHLLQCLYQRLSCARSANRTYDSSSIRTVLSDMLMLLQEQKRLHQQVTQPQCSRYLESPSRTDEVLECSSSSSAIDSPCSPTSDTTCTLDVPDGCCASVEPLVSSLRPKSAQLPLTGSAWLRGLERRLTSHIRRTVRHEIRKALCSRSKVRQKPCNTFLG